MPAAFGPGLILEHHPREASLFDGSGVVIHIDGIAIAGVGIHQQRNGYAGRDHAHAIEVQLEAHQAANGIHATARGKRVMIQRADGFAGLKALLPPPSRRGLVLIDPPYEDKDDYRKVRLAIEESQKRFATGTYAVWYPALGRLEDQQLPERLKRCAASDWLHVSLSIGSYAEGQGLHSSGMFIINPPWTLKAALEQAMPWLANVLGHGSGSYVLQSGTAARVKKERDE